MQKYPNLLILREGPAEVRFSEEGNTFLVKDTCVSDKWVPLVLSRWDSCFIKVLTLLRDISPGWKMSPYPSFILDSNGKQIYYVTIHDARANMINLRKVAGPLSMYHVLRWRDGTDAAYFGPEVGYPMFSDGAVKFYEETPFAQLDPRYLDSILQKFIAQREDLTET